MSYLTEKLYRAGLALAVAGCLCVPGGMAVAQTASNNGSLQAAVSNALRKDAMLKDQPIIATVSGSVVTLTGTVDTEQQQQEAETVAANVDGVSGIADHMTVTGQTGQTAATSSAQTVPAPPADTQQAPPPPPPDNQQEPAATAGSGQMPPPPPPDTQQTAPRAPYTPAPGYQGYGSEQQPPSGPVTVPAGTLLQIRLSEPLDIAKLQDGTTFQATAASDVFEGNVLAIPRGAVLNGTVVKVKKPGALGGSGELQLQISSLNLGGRVYPIATDLWSNKGPNKAGYTATNTAGGALVGALIGGLMGRGAGAAVGAVVGGGAGMAASAATNGPRLYLPPEALLNFHLSTPVTVQPVSWQEAQRLAQNAPQLQRRYPYARPYPYPYEYPYPYPYRAYGW